MLGLRLAIDTSGPRGTVGLFDDLRLLEAIQLDPGKGYGLLLAPSVERALAHARRSAKELVRITVALGPGSFAGTRVAVSFAKGMAFATGAALVGITSAQALMFGVDATKMPVALIDAGRGHAYAGVGTELFFGSDDEVRRFVIEHARGERVLVGNACDRFSELGAASAKRTFVDVSMLDLAARDLTPVSPEELVPAYVQPPRITLPRSAVLRT